MIEWIAGDRQSAKLDGWSDVIQYIAVLKYGHYFVVIFISYCMEASNMNTQMNECMKIIVTNL